MGRGNVMVILRSGSWRSGARAEVAVMRLRLSTIGSIVSGHAPVERSRLGSRSVVLDRRRLRQGGFGPTARGAACSYRAGAGDAASDGRRWRRCRRRAEEVEAGPGAHRWSEPGRADGAAKGL